MNSSTHADSSRLTNDDRMRLRTARRRAGARLGFLIHLAVYGAVNLSLLAIDLMSTPRAHWAQYPLLGWGLGLLIHGLVVFAMPQLGALHGRLVEQELKRLGD